MPKQKKINVGIIGCLGYGGIGTIELLLSHPYVELTALINRTEFGKKISDLFPHLLGHCDQTILNMDDTKWQNRIEMIFCATPDGVAQNWAAQCYKKGIRMIDFSGDFRFKRIEDYKIYASRIGRESPHACPELLKGSAYGLPEINRINIKKSSLVGNPGCFATACILAMAPALKENLVDLKTLIFDGKTGISGAGKKPNPLYHYPEIYDNMRSYKINRHQHVLEIKNQLSQLSSGAPAVDFTPSVMPVNRGILVSAYAKALPAKINADFYKIYRKFYQNEPFVRVFSKNDALCTADVRGTNFCHLSVNYNAETNSLIVISHIDNLMKGQAGNAVQNFNIMYGFPEDTGLNKLMPHP